MRYRDCRFSLRLTGAGRLQPWLGPALRGLVALRFKEAVCRHPPAERKARWVHCSGCPHMESCAYGQTFEPDPPAGVKVQPGRLDAIRPVVLAPYYPVAAEGGAGLEVPLRLTAVGEQAVRHVLGLLDTLATSGRQGLGADGVRFELGPLREDRVSNLPVAELPEKADAVRGVVPRLGVGLTAPLFLTRQEERGAGGGRKRVIGCPSLADLLRASLRSVGELFRLYGGGLRADFDSLKEAAEGVRLVEHCYERFKQGRWSSRGEQHYELLGVVGGGVYEDVPLVLIPWLMWGGRLHVGGHRVAGAGSWRLLFD